jgi:hypothetical protein
MINILGQAYLSLDEHLDTKKFDSIIDEIVIGIAKSKYAAGPTNTGSGYLDTTIPSTFEIHKTILKDSTHPYHSTIKQLKNWEPFVFIQYKWPSHALGQCLVLRSPGIGLYETKHDPDQCKDFSIISNFTPLMDWLVSENIFQHIGRIVIFLNDPNSRVLEHRDYSDGISRKDQFIWISPLGSKKFYVRDDSKKIYFDSRFCYFDNANIHGADSINHASFSIRIDGTFSENFLDKTNLREHLSEHV